MVRLIQKSSFIKAGRAGGYMKYIATREGVEQVTKDGPVSKEQRSLIASILKDYPDTKKLFEYEDYRSSPSLKTASAFISMALDCHVQDENMRDGYMKYIAMRPGAELHGTHGLFSKERDTDLDSALEQLNMHRGNVWTIIYSLRREDAVQHGYDHANGWRELILRHEIDLAESMKVRPGQLQWYAAFHDAGSHPHIHMMLWSDNPKAYLSKEHLFKLRSVMTNDIFKDELLNIYQRKDLSYKELIAAARTEMKELTERIRFAQNNAELDQKLAELSAALETVGGKHQYGYLPKPLKRMVDEIVDELSELPEVRDAYAAWNGIRDELEQYYKDKPREHLPLREQKEFKAVKNIIIREADVLRTELRREDEAKEAVPQFAQQTAAATPAHTNNEHDTKAVQSSVRLLYHLSRIFQDNAIPPGNPLGARIDSKRRKKLQEKRMALGHKPDDHEDQISWQQTM